MANLSSFSDLLNATTIIAVIFSVSVTQAQTLDPEATKHYGSCTVMTPIDDFTDELYYRLSRSDE